MDIIFSTILNFFSDFGYWGVFFLMTIESSFIPFPSEIVIPPAAYLASQGQYNVYLVVLFGILGTLLGALINYFLALKLGRTIIYSLLETRIAKYLFLDQDKIKKSEDYFLKYGNISTFVGRLVPAVRQLISIPAGFSKMNLKSFIFYTSLGSGIWISILAILGYQLGANKELLSQYYSQIKTGLWFLGLVFIVYLFIKIRKK
ncbi:MAG: DedA family protein [Patescibacteria group bacterium]|jgi:membrane protein DedA with SNARE-associated domain|nr:DedA family protein [Patescibacteria group bacterium]